MKTKQFKNADQIRREITQKMIDSLNNEIAPWRACWVKSRNGGYPHNFLSRRRYTGINPLILYLSSYQSGFQSSNWGTAASWTKQLGAHVKKGQKATYVTMFKQLAKKNKETGVVETNSKGKPVTIPMLREYAVFNAEQIQSPDPEVFLGVPKPFTLIYNLLNCNDTKRSHPTTKEELVKIAQKYANKEKFDTKMSREQIAKEIHLGIKRNIEKYLFGETKANSDPDYTPAEELISKSKAKIIHGEQAAYTLLGNYIIMPKKSQFLTISDYYQTMFHEMIHWVFDGGKIEGKKEDHGRAFSELVAEIGSCFVLSALEVPLADKMISKSQSYVKQWIGVMNSDPKYIFDAASIAGRASEYLLDFVGKANPPIEETDTE